MRLNAKGETGENQAPFVAFDEQPLLNQNDCKAAGVRHDETITLKGIPDGLYEQLRLSAEVNPRSLNSEAIACLETVLLPRKVTAIEHVAKAREIRATLKRRAFKPADIDRAKREGRAWSLLT